MKAEMPVKTSCVLPCLDVHLQAMAFGQSPIAPLPLHENLYAHATCFKIPISTIASDTFVLRERDRSTGSGIWVYVWPGLGRSNLSAPPIALVDHWW